MANVSDAVRRYKVGVTEDPWQKIDHEKVRESKVAKVFGPIKLAPSDEIIARSCQRPSAPREKRYRAVRLVRAPPR